MNIIFMGSAEFAVPSLDALVYSQHKVLEVIAQPDKPAGRGQKIKACPVAEFARSHDFKLFQPASVRTQDVIKHIFGLSPDLIVVVAYGKILPKDLIAIPKHGCINVHASLLPKYRGAAPINWSIANGEHETGVTTMFINENLDSGDTLLMEATPIKDTETATELHDRLAKMGADLLIETIDKIKANSIKPVPQDHSKATFAPIIKKEDGRIDWNMPAQAIVNRVRGFTPWPGAFTTLDGRFLRIHKAEALDLDHGKPPGSILDAKNRLVIACGIGALSLIEVQTEGGKRMAAADFLRGHKIKTSAKLI